LEKLYLVFNQISKIPPQISNLVNLRELYLHYNQLEILPSELFSKLNFTFHNLPSLALNKLEKLDISNNKIINISENLTKLTKLKELDVSENPLSSPLNNVAASGMEPLMKYLKNGTLPASPKPTDTFESPGEEAKHNENGNLSETGTYRFP